MGEKKAGWYQDPDAGDTRLLRYWDGRDWTAKTTRRGGGFRPGEMTVGKLIAGTTLGILLAAVVIWSVVVIVHDNQRQNCVIDNADRAISGIPAKDCGD